MKLLNKTTLWYMICLMAMLLLAGFVLFFLLKKEVNDEMNEQLMLEAETVKADISRGNYPQSLLIRVDSMHNSIPASNAVFTDSLVYDQNQKKNENYKILTVTDSINGKYYRIRVMDSHIGTDKYMETILRIFLIMAVVFSILAVLINYVLSRQIWKPFFSNLQAVKSFSVKGNNNLQLQSSGITEFEELKDAIEDLASRSRQEYISLNEFTENASHEIQTPLAVIRAKLDRLSQVAINQEMAEQIQIARAAAERLSRTNKNLLLLAKLENDLYDDHEPVVFTDLLNNQLLQMEELFQLHNVMLEKKLANHVLVKGNIHLCEILISNLVANALQYSPENGKVQVTLDAGKFVITNEGQPLPFTSSNLFKRFIRAVNNRGTGLGLAIVKEICQLHEWQISYAYTGNRHVFIVWFHAKPVSSIAG